MRLRESAFAGPPIFADQNRQAGAFGRASHARGDMVTALCAQMKIGAKLLPSLKVDGLGGCPIGGVRVIGRRNHLPRRIPVRGGQLAARSIKKIAARERSSTLKNSVVVAGGVHAFEPVLASLHDLHRENLHGYIFDGLAV